MRRWITYRLYHLLIQVYHRISWTIISMETADFALIYIVILGIIYVMNQKRVGKFNDINLIVAHLTHWDRVTHINVSKLTIVGSNKIWFF